MVHFIPGSTVQFRQIEQDKQVVIICTSIYTVCAAKFPPRRMELKSPQVKNNRIRIKIFILLTWNQNRWYSYINHIRSPLTLIFFAKKKIV